MMTTAPQILTPLPGPKGNIFTRVTAYVRLGRGVVGNTTFGLWATCILAAIVCGTFTWQGYPGYAILALLICAIWFLAYQGITWIGVGRSPDPGVSADEDYAQVIATRSLGAKDPAIIYSSAPILGASVNSDAGADDET